ncbi:MAG: rhomboid family intramembrane serine protease [Armatimonadota bacterium]
MIPLRDSLRSRKTPVVTVGIIGVCLLVYGYQVMEPRVTQLYGFRPVELVSWEVVERPLAVLRTLVTSVFLHGGLLHIGGNMLFLWVFGDNVEDRLGHLKFIVFYIVCGVAANLVHALSTVVSGDASTPTVGASGAIAGVLGAYFVAFRGARVLTFIPFLWFFGLVEVQAFFWIGFWFVMQLFPAIGSLGGGGSNIAFFAHIGGFLAGILLWRLMAPRPRPPAVSRGARLVRFEEEW